jgi:hypothetical protein
MRGGGTMRIFILLSIVLFASCSETKFNKNILFIGLEPPESRGNLNVCNGQGWADLNLLMICENNITRFIVFPRDTLVNIPGRGPWLINAIYYNCKNSGTKQWFATNFNIQIDNIFVFSVSNLRTIIKDILSSGPDSKIVEYLSHYTYDEDWLRHRHKLKSELHRGLRILKYIDYSIFSTKYIPLSGSVLSNISKIIVKNITYTDLTEQDILGLRKRLYTTQTKYYVWSGVYTLAKFDYSWYKNSHYVYILKDKSYTELILNSPEVINPYIFDRKDFFKKSNVKLFEKYATNTLYFNKFK